MLAMFVSLTRYEYLVAHARETLGSEPAFNGTGKACAGNTHDLLDPICNRTTVRMAGMADA